MHVCILTTLCIVTTSHAVIESNILYQVCSCLSMEWFVLFESRADFESEAVTDSSIHEIQGLSRVLVALSVAAFEYRPSTIVLYHRDGD